MKQICHSLAAAAAALLAAPLAAEDLVTFERIKLTDKFQSEGGSIGDFNKDGKKDVVYGNAWYEGPDFKTAHVYYKDKTYDPNGYSNNFFSFAIDFNGDGWDDIFVLGFPGKEVQWYENPKDAKGSDAEWKKNVVFNIVDNESPDFRDIDGDGKPELIMGTDGFLGYAKVDWAAPEKPWTFKGVTPKGKWHKYTHGIGFGDVDGDKKQDLLEAKGWWQQTADGNAPWTLNAADFGGGGAQMYTYDVDGDGDNDIVTSLQAHGYGLAWFEQVKEGEKITFKKNVITGAKPAESKYGIVFSQLHAVALVDIDGDGLLDIVTGKRYWAHGPKGDPEPGAPAVLYWFKLVRKDGKAEYIPYKIDDDSGVGVQLTVGDVNGDGLPDILSTNKKGSSIFIQKKKTVTKEEWEAAQPKVPTP